ncbi:MAG: GPW/gp25 family protein [Pseudomonadota bacterium]
MHIAWPYRIARDGRSATATDEEHIRQMIEQVLFTSPGERVNRPEFGSGLLNLVFGPNSPELAAATEFTVQGALQQWLGEVISVESVAVESSDSKLTVHVSYMVRRSQQRRVAEFSRQVG